MGRNIYSSPLLVTAVTARGQTHSSPLTYSLYCVFPLAISAPMRGAYWFIYPL